MRKHRLSLPKKFVVSHVDGKQLAALEYDSEGQILCEKILANDNGFSKLTPNQRLDLFLNSDLPLLLEGDSDADPRKAKVLHKSSLTLIRDLEVPNTIGTKHRISAPSIHSKDKSILPGLPNLVYEDYPLFIPCDSGELTNETFIGKYLQPFRKVLKERIKASFVPMHSMNLKVDIFQQPCRLSLPLESDEYMELFNDKIWATLMDVFLLIIYDKKKLAKFLDECYDGYIPILTPTSPVNLKPIGSIADTRFTWGIFDYSTKLINKLLVHIEVLDLRLGISEGYELSMGSRKSKTVMHGSEFTKRNNFQKRFTKCVAICLNSHTRRFIMTDYHWCGCFEIVDVMDGEIQDATRLISKVKVNHFAYSTFDSVDTLTVRNVIASFLYITPEISTRDTKHMAKLNRRVSEEWTLFNDISLVQRHRKRSKPSPVTYSTSNGITFTKSHVDLDAATLGFIAVGSHWSCQTLLVDVGKLFLDKHVEYGKEGLLTVYDEYYQDYGLLMTARHTSTPASKLEESKSELKNNARSLVQRWSTNVNALLQLEPLQGDVLARVISYGFLEDVKYNTDCIHFRTDGYYILYEPITEDNDDLAPLDLKDGTHRALAFDAVSKVHSLGVTFHPNIDISYDVLKFANDKVYIINLEKTTMHGTEGDKRRDMANLRRIFERRRESL